MRKGAGTFALVLLCMAASAFAGSLAEWWFPPRVSPEHLAEARATANPVPATADSVRLGQELFQQIGCNGCHGEDGAADDPGVDLHPPPHDLTNPAWQEARTDGELRYIILYGADGTAMIANQSMFADENDVWHVINFIRSLKK